MKFLKKSEIVEAFQFTEQMVKNYLLDKVPLPPELICIGAVYNSKTREVISYRFKIKNSDPRIIVNPNDWVVTQENNYVLSFKDSLFKEKFELIEVYN